MILWGVFNEGVHRMRVLALCVEHDLLMEYWVTAIQKQDRLEIVLCSQEKRDLFMRRSTPP